jgi:hypothetical protein
MLAGEGMEESGTGYEKGADSNTAPEQTWKGIARGRFHCWAVGSTVEAVNLSPEP